MADLLETHQELTALLKGGEAVLNVPAELAKRTVSLCEELQQAREEALMKPSVARKLNERIRTLEGELDLLRSNKKVIELEKKVQFLEAELRGSYSTKTFTLKSSLMELGKKYREHIERDPVTTALWNDVTALLRRPRRRIKSSVAARGAAGAAAGARMRNAPRAPRMAWQAGGLSGI